MRIAFDADPDYRFDADPDTHPDPSFQVKAIHTYILSCRLQIDADPDPA
jgi:hypothetical protein